MVFDMGSCSTELAEAREIQSSRGYGLPYSIMSCLQKRKFFSFYLISFAYLGFVFSVVLSAIGNFFTLIFSVVGKLICRYFFPVFSGVLFSSRCYSGFVFSAINSDAALTLRVKTIFTERVFTEFRNRLNFPALCTYLSYAHEEAALVQGTGGQPSAAGVPTAIP